MSLPAWAYLAIAIASEVVATSALKAAAGFTKPGPSIAVVAGYSIAFACLSLALKTIPVGVAYAIWSGLGIVAVSAIAWVVYGQRLDGPAIAGIGLILAGVIVLQLFSSSAVH